MLFSWFWWKDRRHVHLIPVLSFTHNSHWKHWVCCPAQTECFVSFYPCRGNTHNPHTLLGIAVLCKTLLCFSTITYCKLPLSIQSARSACPHCAYYSDREVWTWRDLQRNLQSTLYMHISSLPSALAPLTESIGGIPHLSKRQTVEY